MQIQQEASSNKQCAISASPKRSYCVFLNSIDSLSCSGHTEMHYVPGLKEAAEKQNASCFTMKNRMTASYFSDSLFYFPTQPV